MGSGNSGGSSQQVSSKGTCDGGCIPSSSSTQQQWPDEVDLPCQ